jgi:serine/threonine protein kinase
VITDFGIAKVIATEDAQRTLAILGTPAYMSPEQVTGGDIDASSDVFSLGILLYLMLTGEKPFSGDTAAVMFKIAYQDPAPPSQVKSELGKGHDFLLLRALAKDKKKRYASAREFLDDLDDLTHARPLRSEARVPMSELHAGDLTVRASRPLVPALKSSPAAVPKKTHGLWTAGLAALVALLAVGLWALRHRYTPPPPFETAAKSAASSHTEAAKPPARTASNAGNAAAEPNNQNLESAAAKGKAGARPSPAPPTATPEVLRKPQPSAAVQPPAASRSTIQLYSKYELEEATLTLSADGQNLFSVVLKGRKTGKFLGLKHGYQGTFSKPITIPSAVHNLTVHIASEDGSINLTRTIPRSAAGKKTPVLHVTASAKELELTW